MVVFVKERTAYEVRISDWSADVCSSDLVERRKDALVGDLAVEHDFRVTRALEFFEDDLVHAAAGIDQRGGDYRQRTAFLDVARGAEETLRALKRIGVDAAGQNLARRGNDGVVGAAEARDRIEQDDDRSEEHTSEIQ